MSRPTGKELVLRIKFTACHLTITYNGPFNITDNYGILSYCITDYTIDIFSYCLRSWYVEL